uniref:Uncharacterized protein n=1 Tax=Plectus sambesii TaxID=2011161 RepID=A0A914VHC5_9BILA
MGRIRSNSISLADDDGKLAPDRTPAARSLLNKRGGADCENRLTSHETKRRPSHYDRRGSRLDRADQGRRRRLLLLPTTPNAGARVRRPRPAPKNAFAFLS